MVVPLPSLLKCMSERGAQKTSSNTSCSRLAWHEGKLPVVLSARGPMQTGVQASLPDVPSQLQKHRAAPLVLLPAGGGSA